MKSERLTEWRNRHGLSIREAAGVFGVDRGAWARYESGEKPVPLVLRWALAGHALAHQPYE